MRLRRGLSVCKEPGHVFRGDAVDRAVNAACAEGREDAGPLIPAAGHGGGNGLGGQRREEISQTDA